MHDDEPAIKQHDWVCLNWHVVRPGRKQFMAFDQSIMKGIPPYCEECGTPLWHVASVDKDGYVWFSYYNRLPTRVADSVEE